MNRRSLLGKIAALPLVGLVQVPASVDKTQHAVWTTADGRQIPFTQLTDNHLLNVERVLRGDSWMRYNREDKDVQHARALGEIVRRGLRTKESSHLHAWERWPFDLDPWGD